MLSEGDELDARQRWPSSLMNLQSSSSASLAVNSHLYHTYQPSMTAYTDCGRPIADLTGYTAGFGGYRYVSGDSPYNTITSSTVADPTDRFRLQRGLWGETVTSRGGCGTFITPCSCR